jgi:hypothetical protein
MKPKNYYGFAFDDCKSGYNKKYLKTKEGKKEIKKCKKRHKKLRKHYKKHGWDPSETWNLDQTMAMFLSPRLKYFRENLHGYPDELEEKEWEKILEKIQYSVDCAADNYDCLDIEDITKRKKKYKKIKEGFKLLGKYFMHLWD